MHDLFWETVYIAIKPKKCRAPSWSWASLDGRINWPLCAFSFRVVSVACTTSVDLDPYGAVKDGFLKVQGVFEEMKIVTRQIGAPLVLMSSGQGVEVPTPPRANIYRGFQSSNSSSLGRSYFVTKVMWAGGDRSQHS
jgi:hypothetical protein